MKNRKNRKSLLARCLFFFVMVMLIVPELLLAAPYVTLNKGFNRRSSHVLIRAVAGPTAANLDAAAYIGNPVRDDPKPESPKKPGRAIGVAGCTFGGAVVDPCVSLAQT